MALSAIIVSAMSSAEAGDISDSLPIGEASLELRIDGYIAPRCEISLETDKIELDLKQKQGRKSVLVTVNCNEELVIEMRSEFGALLFEKPSKYASNQKFTNNLPYGIGFDLNAKNAQPVFFKSEDIHQIFRSASTGIIPHQSTGELTFNWSAERPLYGGRYNDLIEIRTSGRGR